MPPTFRTGRGECQKNNRRCRVNKGQFAGVKDGPSSEGNLLMATVVLEGLDLAMPDDAVAVALT